VQEARTVARLNHLNIVTGIDVGEHAGNYYFVMEYVDGDNLGDMLRRGEQIPERRAVEIVGQIAAALEHARQNGLVHRDVKPDNILMTSEGVPKLGDLGLALQRGDEESTKIAGTPHYIAPEVVRREPVDTRADIYSLGVSLFHMLAGEPPFAGTPREVLEQHVNAGVPDPRTVRPEISPRASLLVAGMTARQPAQRYQNPQEVVEAIRVFLEQPGRAIPRPAGMPAPVTQRVAAVRQQRPATSTLITVALVIVLGAGVGMLLPHGDRDAPPRPAPQPEVRDDDPQPPAPPPVDRGETPQEQLAREARAAEAEAALALTAARRFGEQNPEDHEGLVDRLEALRKRFPETESAGKAARQLAELEETWETEAQELVDSLEAEARKLEAEGRAGAALERLQSVPPRLRDTAAGTRAQEACRRLTERIDRRFGEELGQAREHLDADRFSEAITTLEGLRGFLDASRLPRLEEALSEARTREEVHRAHLASQRQERERQARALLEDATMRSRDLLEQLDLAAAEQVWRELADHPGAAAVAAEIEHERALIAGLNAVHTRLLDQLRELAPDRVTYGGTRGRLTLEDGELHVEVAGLEEPLVLALLPAEQLEELASADLEDPDHQGLVAAHRYLLYAGNAAAAVACLRRAEAAGLPPAEVALLRDGLEANQRRAIELEASALWGLGQRLIAGEHWRSAADVLGTLLAGATATSDLVTGQRLEIEDARDLAANDGEPPPLLQKILAGQVEIKRTPRGSPLSVEVVYDFEDPAQLGDFDIEAFAMPGLDGRGGGGGGGPQGQGTPPESWLIEDGRLHGSGTDQLTWKPRVVGDLLVQYEFTTTGDSNIGMVLFQNGGDGYLACLGFALVGERRVEGVLGSARNLLLKLDRAAMSEFRGGPLGALAQGIMDRSTKPDLIPGRKYLVQAIVKGETVAFITNKRERLQEKDRSYRKGDLAWFAYNTSMELDNLKVVARIDLRWLERAEEEYRRARERAAAPPPEDEGPDEQ
jgi:hypothetical protein